MRPSAAVLRAARVLIAVLLPAALFAGAPSPQRSPDGGPETDDVLAVLAAQVEAWNRGDLEAFLDAYHRGPELTFFSGGTVRRGFEPFAERFRERYGGGVERMGRLSFSQLEAEILADEVASVRGRWRLDGLPAAPADAATGEETASQGGLFTLILRHRPGVGWRIVHDHTSSE